MKLIIKFSLIALLLTLNVAGFAQSSGLFVPKNIQKAFDKKTRSEDGKPGIVYWQNRADYKIDLNFDPKTLLLKGSETINYFNNSPDTLRELVIHLFPNMYKKGNQRDADIDFLDESDGVTIDKLVLNGKEISASGNNDLVRFEHTLMTIKLRPFLLPQRQLSLDISWNYTLNRESHIRTGAVDSTTFFIAYFFPRIAVYDDINGWNYYRYTNEREFYNDFGNFDVSINVPTNYIVRATGLLKNPEEVLSEKYLNRYKAAWQSNILVRIIDTSDLEKGNFTLPNPINKWNFKAENVPDFAFGICKHYLWDAMSLIVDKATSRKVLIDAVYNPQSKDFYQVVKIAQQSIDYMCNTFPGVPYPYPKVTIFNGLSEMEYPMMVNNHSYEDIHSTIDLTAHEVFHAYFPFYTGFNEIDYAWMDEGITTFATYLITSTIDPSYAQLCFLDSYRPIIGTDIDIPIFTNSNYLVRPVYDYISYTKSGLFFLTLRDVLGVEVFNKAFREFIARWNGKHPMPYDLFNTISNVSGQNLDWFIRPWIFEYGYPDLSVKNIELENSKYSIIIERKGNYPVPVDLKIYYNDGSSETIHHSAEVWKNGDTLFTIQKPGYRKIQKVVLEDFYKIDANPSNNTYLNDGRKQKIPR
ncbi:MAG: M1 family metallopeptidase [Tenuifilaceae bacterium]